MAWYKYGGFVSEANLPEFDTLELPGTLAKYTGVYRCEVCGREDVSTSGQPLPSADHHQHHPGQGPILWRLIVVEREMWRSVTGD